MPELTEAALRQKNASDANSEAAHEKQTVKGFHDERDRYKEFLVTGDSVHQRQEKSTSNSKGHQGGR